MSGVNTTAYCKCDCGKTYTTHLHRLLNRKDKSAVMCRGCGCMSDDPWGAEMRSYIGMSANRRGIAFSIHKDEFVRMVTSDCLYCGAKPSFRSGGRMRNGIDRIDSSLGYVPGNVVPCCLGCNKAKMKRPVIEFLMWAKRV